MMDRLVRGIFRVRIKKTPAQTGISLELLNVLLY